MLGLHCRSDQLDLRDCPKFPTERDLWLVHDYWTQNNQPFPKQALVFTCLQYKPLENTVRKGEIARYEQFLLFPQCFLLVCRTFFLLFSKLCQFGRV